MKEKIKAIWIDSKKRYGAPKIREQLVAKGYRIGQPRVQKLMKELGIRSIIVKRYKPQVSKKTEEIEGLENKLEQNFKTERVKEKWVTDITYIWTKRNGWCYLASVMDLYNNEIMGWSFGRTMTTELIKDALAKALKKVRYPKGVIVHSDRGSQYTSAEYRAMLIRNGLIGSYSKKGCPYDNACIESFHAALKKELIYVESYETFEDAKWSIFEYIESFYNRIRIQARLGYKSPMGYRAAA